MNRVKSQEAAHEAVDHAAERAHHAIRSTQHAVNDGVDDIAHAGNGAATSPWFDRIGDQASTMAHRSVDALRERSLHLREQAVRASDGTLAYVRDEPVKSMLIAAAAGAAIMAVLSLLRSRP